MDSLRLSMVCMNSRIGDLERNLEIHNHRIREAADSGSDILCFPELSLTGYAMPDSSHNLLDLDSTAVRKVVSLSDEYSIAICFGFAESGKYITHAVAENGELLGIYRKTHLGERESAVMIPGNELPVFMTSKAIIGI